MKEKIDFPLALALLRKERQERRARFQKGNFDVLGFLLALALAGAFVVFFVSFFGKFLQLYLTVKTRETSDPAQRLYELLTISYALVLILMTASGMTAITRELFLADDVKLFSAMPVGAKTLFVAKLVSIYRGRLLLSAASVLTVNLTTFFTTSQGSWFLFVTVLLIFILPVVSIALAAALALPYYALRRFLEPRSALLFVAVTLLTAGALVLYFFLLGGVKELLLGDDLRYFFNARVMNGIRIACEYLYPANWLASITLKHEFVRSIAGMVCLLLVCIFLSLLIIRNILTRVLMARISGKENFLRKKREMGAGIPVFGSLIKKEFVEIFRTPSYMFSYFSIAILMPLMVYFCMEVGSALVHSLIGLNIDLELALFLTLLFSALTNVFCATNISREGMMFYTVKAFPVSWREVFFSKIVFCMIVSVCSQLISALTLVFAHGIGWPSALFIFAVGTLFSFAQICFATRYDFNHARFSTEEDGEIKESGSTVSAIIVLGMVCSLLVGGAIFMLRVVFALSLRSVAVAGALSYLISASVTLIAAGLSYWYLVRRLRGRYYEFSGGGI